MNQEQAVKQATEIINRYYDGLYTLQDLQFTFINLAQEMVKDSGFTEEPC
jgi:hypothetical protein